MRNALEIDGAEGEGGGQLVRTAVALSAITGMPIRVHNIRAKRAPPGLAPQHVAAVQAVAALCTASIEGATMRSATLEFVPGPLAPGEFAFNVGTAGSIALVLQALLPAMVRALGACRVRVTGGTDVRAAPPVDYFRNVLLPLLARMGVVTECMVRRRGYYPRGGGEVEIRTGVSHLQPLLLDRPDKPAAIDGLAHVSNLPSHIPERMRGAALARLARTRVPAKIEEQVLSEAIGQGGAIVLWAHTEEAVLGAGRVAERGVRSEALGEAVAAEIAADLAAGATLDVHAADQMLVWLALARGDSSFATREITPHAATAMWLIERFLPARFDVRREPGLTRVQVRVPTA